MEIFSGHSTFRRSFLFGSLLMGLSMFSLAQVKSGESFESKVIDASSAQPLPLVNILVMPDGQGTVSNDDGWFRLEGLVSGDTLVFSFIGYKTLYLEFDQMKGKEIISLEPEISMLSEVSVFGDNSFLYKLLGDVKRNRRQEDQTAKTYFSLNTKVGNRQVELIECYYNGEYRAGDIRSLLLKNGRIVLDAYRNRYFINTGSSRTIIEFKTFERNAYFPDAPFRMSARQIKKFYDLSVRSRILSFEGHVLYAIQFDPVSDKQMFFNGLAWVDSNTRQLVRYEMEVRDAGIIPFQALWESDTLVRMDLSISKTLGVGDPEDLRSNLMFDVLYQDRDGLTYNVTTTAFLAAYNFEEAFVLPYSFTDELALTDYQRILTAPYNNFFWDHMNEFGLGELKDKNEEFARRKGEEEEQDRIIRSSSEVVPLLEGHEIYWSTDRVVFKEVLPTGLSYSDLVSWIPSTRYRLRAHLYLDRNEMTDSIDILSATIFDPYASYFYYPIDNTALAFINLYFDLVEIQRRKMMAEIRASDKSEEEVSRIYTHWSNKVEEITEKYMREVDRGTDLPSFHRWNKIVQKELGIDNGVIFGIPGSGE